MIKIIVERYMKRTILTATGIVLIILGVCYVLFWGQAMREAETLYSGDQTQTEETIRNQSPRFVKATHLLGVDLFAPATEEPSESPEDLALRISRGMYTHAGLGALAILVGFAVLIAGLLTKAASPDAPGQNRA